MTKNSKHDKTLTTQYKHTNYYNDKEYENIIEYDVNNVDYRLVTRLF